MAIHLKKYRESTGLTQKEIAKRLGFSIGYISHLESGKIKNPTLGTIILYLKTIRVPWAKFFGEMEAIDFSLEHKKLFDSVVMETKTSKRKYIKGRLMRKLDGDSALYSQKIQYPKTPVLKPDLDLVKIKVYNKIFKYCNTLQIKENLIPLYQKFAMEIVKSLKHQPIIDKYKKLGLNSFYFSPIIGIANRTYHAEEKKLQKQNPLLIAKHIEMTKKYLQSRIDTELIENEVNKLLNIIVIPEVLYPAYRAFTRECVKVIKKYHRKDPSLLKQKLLEIIKKWTILKLDGEILEKVKATIIRFFEDNDKKM